MRVFIAKQGAVRVGEQFDSQIVNAIDSSLVVVPIVSADALDHMIDAPVDYLLLEWQVANRGRVDPHEFEENTRFRLSSTSKVWHELWDRGRLASRFNAGDRFRTIDIGTAKPKPELAILRK